MIKYLGLGRKGDSGIFHHVMVFRVGKTLEFVDPIYVTLAAIFVVIIIGLSVWGLYLLVTKRHELQ
jgi:hypothetical protein